MRFCKMILPLLALVCMSCGRRVQQVEIEQIDTVYPLGFLTDTLFVVDTRVRSGEAFTSLMQRLGMSADSAYALAQVCDTTFDVRKVVAGHNVDAYYSGDSLAPLLEYVIYEQDRVQSTVFKCRDSLAMWSIFKQVDTVRKYTDVTINSSLWNDLKDAGASPALIMDLADIYAWTVDFFGLQKGDRFRVLYSQREIEGEVIEIFDLDLAEFTRDSTDIYAVHFETPEGGNKYWKANGESLKKAFLKAPLKFTRVSSRFSYHRRHPVYGTVRPHTGVDYAAPSGTPVHALGDGVVLSAGWGGGGGNTVKIKHNSIYTTGYLHLRGYAKGIKSGVRVKQGQVIGYVGSTGTSTGPHLDFRVWKNGKPIDPLSMASPDADPIADRYLPALDSVFNTYKAEADSLAAAALRGPDPDPWSLTDTTIVLAAPDTSLATPTASTPAAPATAPSTSAVPTAATPAAD